MNESTTAPATNLRGTPGKLVGFLTLVGVVSALNYAGNYAGRSSKESTDTALYHYSTAIGAAVIYALILFIVLWITAGQPRGSSRHSAARFLR